MKKIHFYGWPQRQMLTSKDIGSTDNNLPSLPRSCGDKTIIQVCKKNRKKKTLGVNITSPTPFTKLPWR